MLLLQSVVENPNYWTLSIFYAQEAGKFYIIEFFDAV